ncbi:hypothetical protein VPH35_027557 [Triticum aestivum]
MPFSTWASAAAIAVGEGLSGFHLFQIVSYSCAKDIATGMSLRSCPFMIGKIDKFDLRGKANDIIGVSCALMQDIEQPVKVHTAFSFIDEVENQDLRYVHSGLVTHVPRRHSVGFPRYIARNDFENSKHLNYDCFTIRCDLVVLEEGRQH